MKKDVETNSFNKQYTVMIDTVPLPESPVARADLVINGITPTINQIVSDAMTVAIGTWPTPEKPEIGSPLIQKVASHILKNRRGADYYQDAEQMAKYIQKSLDTSETQAITIADEINQDRQGANYYANQEILQQFLQAKMLAKQGKSYNKNYMVMIEANSLPEKPDEKVNFVMKRISPVLNQIISDAMTVAIGTWPQPEKPRHSRAILNIEE